MSQKPPSNDPAAPAETKADPLGFDNKSEPQADAGSLKQPRRFDNQHKQSSV